MKILLTGAAGFIGYHLSLALLEKNYYVTGLDNLNDYYDPKLKLDRLKKISNHRKSINFKFVKGDIVNRELITSLFEENSFDIVINLAAQAGVRYSITNPHAYVDSNLIGFVNILESCRHFNIKHLVYASSSSVYGMSTEQPFSTSHKIDQPISLYAATKKSNELMAHTYSHLYSLPTTGLRFFTVYGPFGRPDMAYYKFTKSILEGKSIDIYNHGKMKRDFTYISDIVDGVIKVLKHAPEKDKNGMTNAAYQIFNIGNGKPESLDAFVRAIESACNKTAKRNNMPMQPGDVIATYADIEDFTDKVGYIPKVNINDGIKNFVSWYIDYYKHNQE